MSHSKLSDMEKYEIASLYFVHSYTQRELADLFQVSRATVRRAIETEREHFLDEIATGPEPAHSGPTYFDVEQIAEGMPAWMALGFAFLLGFIVVAIIWFAINA